MTREDIIRIAIEAGARDCANPDKWDIWEIRDTDLERFVALIVRECIDKIETYRIPVGNSASGELACEWTYAALKEIRDEIKEHFGIES